MASRTAQLAVIDLIFAGTVSRRSDVFAEQFDKTKTALLMKLRGAAGVPGQAGRNGRASAPHRGEHDTKQ
jgi:hypothetical protein